jgi:ATP-dependent RNA helicase RhlE
LSGFASLQIASPLLEALDRVGYKEPTPIQARVIPPILQGRDILALSPTGTGKSAGFLLPLLTRLLKEPPMLEKYAVALLIVAPTKELATQLGEEIERYAHATAIRWRVVYGGVGIHPQLADIRRGVDILIATPKRLLEIMGRGGVKFDRLQTLVIDEADRLLDRGFIGDLEAIIHSTPPSRQTLLFFATSFEATISISKRFLKQPLEVRIEEPLAMSPHISEHLYRVEESKKRQLLVALMQRHGYRDMLIFVSTKQRADRLVRELREHEGIEAISLHAGRSHASRAKVLERLKSGEVRLVVATDVASRGIDIPSLACVVNYELPSDVPSYVHRIGRTGRGGERGASHTFVTHQEKAIVEMIESTLSYAIPRIEMPPFTSTLSMPQEKAKKRPKRRERSQSDASQVALKIQAKLDQLDKRGKSKRR